MSEDFSDGLPSGWTISGTNTNTDWAFGNPADYVVGGVVLQEVSPGPGASATSAAGPGFPGPYAASPARQSHLTSAPIDLSNAEDPILRFDSFLNLDDDTAGWDVGILQISTDGGSSFTQIPSSAFITGGYNTTVATGNMLPSGTESYGHTLGWHTVTVDLTGLIASANAVVFRWTFSTDNAFGGYAGWYVTNVFAGDL